MNYRWHYERLIKRGKEKNHMVDVYYENHHILPKCLGGTDSNDNLVKLTAREHFIAHLLLIKIYPDKFGLIKAISIMCAFSHKNFDRGASLNRMYGWLRKKLSECMSECQSGERNSQYGTMWVSDVKNKISKRVTKANGVPEGFVKGRNIWIKMKQEEEQKTDRELKKQEKTNVLKEKWRPMFEDYKNHSFEYVKEKYGLTMKIASFSKTMKRHFGDEHVNKNSQGL